MKKLIFTLLFIFLTVNCFAKAPATTKQRETLKEKLIGNLVKTFAKSYVAATNLQKFKEKNIKKILKMDEAKFQRVYGKIYKEMIVDLPLSLKENYGVREQMTRQDIVERINSFTNKKQIYQMINAIPNKMIAKHYKTHKKEFKKTMKNNSGADGMIDQLLEDPAASS